MKFKQKMLKRVYPLFMKAASVVGLHSGSFKNKEKVAPLVSVYDLEVETIEGVKMKLEEWKNMYMLVVNTASYCGYTAQYEELEKLYRKYADRLVVLAFPSNDFNGQEPDPEDEIAAFCERNYNISFPLMKKSTVLPGTGQHPVFHWLTDPAQNGWNNHPPAWNFTKYLIDPSGKLLHVFESTVSPVSKEIVQYFE